MQALIHGFPCLCRSRSVLSAIFLAKRNIQNIKCPSTSYNFLYLSSLIVGGMIYVYSIHYIYIHSSVSVHGTSGSNVWPSVPLQIHHQCISIFRASSCCRKWIKSCRLNAQCHLPQGNADFMCQTLHIYCWRSRVHKVNWMLIVCMETMPIKTWLSRDLASKEQEKRQKFL